jgi:hypothetical protein
MKDVLIKTQKKNKCRKKSETETETEKDRRHRETEIRTQTGVLGIDRWIKGRESEQYLEMHEDEGGAAIAAAAVQKNRTAEEKWSRADALARKKKDSVMALLHLGREREREREKGSARV